MTTPIALTTGARETLKDALQETLADLINLALQIKQAHWNAVGPNFRSVHLQLDELVDGVRETSDAFAERITTLGLPADGSVKMVSSRSSLEAFPEGVIDANDAAQAIAARLASVLEHARARLPGVGEVDPITEDLYVASIRELEKMLWMMHAQTRSA